MLNIRQTFQTQLCNLSRGFTGQILASKSASSTIFVRGKRTKGDELSPATQRVVTQLSVLSATKKQPKLIKLCKEDYIKHLTISSAWSLFQKEKRTKREAQLAKQFSSIQEAMNDLKEISQYLYETSNAAETPKRFPIDMRIPTEYPPNQPWHYDYKPPAQSK